ncbi:alpha/beta hydrolase fold-1 [Akanthomyces lecanii RCEF 1005]|uniref:Alpha/beta hydrolase fold-1 n=1 Tax=Akanthomyces lecanii RCEF 1005 TaxID=1081108 RepID=A0A162JWR2_CORDF|nr:alpha/beta hydrolase fold-1 [Akanthomyces lecanii RCEF 1005]
MRGLIILVGIAASLSSVCAIPVTTLDIRADHESIFNLTNDFDCKSDKNPVVMIHGLSANRNFDLNFLEAWLRPQGYCTYGLTYGEYPELPSVGGLRSIAETSQEIVDFINEVLKKTGAKKVDLVGHSEGGLQALYVAKVRKMSPKIDKIVGIASATHGSDVDSLVTLFKALGLRPGLDDLLKNFGCAACLDVLPDGGPVQALQDGPIVQPGNKVTMIATKHDEAVTPAGKASFINEPGVYNVYTQDPCPIDFSGHITIALDKNMFNMALNALQDKNGRAFECTIFSGLGLKR